MLDWLKYFGLNFFNKKYADESKYRSLGNGILALLMALVLLFAAFCGMARIVFFVRYNNSSEFKAYYHSLFDDKDISVTVQNGKAAFTNSSGDALVVNSFVNQADKHYANNGFNFIVDMRNNNDLYDDCVIQFVSSDSSKIISFEEYAELADSEQKDYSAKLTLTGNIKHFTADVIREYLLFVYANGSDSVKQSLEKLMVDGVVSEENYGAVYQLYFKTRYGGLGSDFSTAPTLRDYYVKTYLATDENGNVYDKFVILLQDIAMMRWIADDGRIATVTGYYGDQALTVNSGDGADELMKNLYDANTLAISISYFLYTAQALLVLCLAWLAFPLVVALVGYFFNDDALSYGAVCKTMGGFWLGSVIPALLFVVIASFFMSQTNVFYVSFAILFATNVIRTIVHCVMVVAQKRANIKAQQEDE